MTTPSRIALVGFMGSGKTTTGRILAGRLGYRFKDADDLVEALAALPIAEIFRVQGEDSFRELERLAISELLSEERMVIATGGGAFAQEACTEMLLAGTFTVHLSCDFGEAYKRVAGESGRPLVEKGESAMAALYAGRKDKYSRAHATIDTTTRSPEEVAAEVLRLLPNS